jgi:hypothetical protein
VKGLVSERGEGERCEASFLDFDPEFLAKFANEALLGALAGFDLAAWEFPKARHGLSGRSLGEKNTSIPINQRDGSDKDELHARRGAQER